MHALDAQEVTDVIHMTPHRIDRVSGPRTSGRFQLGTWRSTSLKAAY